MRDELSLCHQQAAAGLPWVHCAATLPLLFCTALLTSPVPAHKGSLGHPLLEVLLLCLAAILTHGTAAGSWHLECIMQSVLASGWPP